MNYTQQHLRETADIVAALDPAAIDKLVEILLEIKSAGGRLFFLGVGGSAANCSHAVNDFRKLVGVESYAPTDNVAELTARINDDGWDDAFAGWLSVSRLSRNDGVFIFSVGGGDAARNISANLVRAAEYARSVGARILGIVGRDGGYTATVADGLVIIPTVNHKTITPHCEAFQAVIWHLLVSHPALKACKPHWEAVLE